MHWFEEEWKIDDSIYWLDEKILFNYIKIKKIDAIELSFDDIAYRTDIDKTSYRYQKANVKYPMIVTDMINPREKPFRLLDGKHRIHKLMELNATKATFYVIPSEYVLKNLRKI